MTTDRAALAEAMVPVACRLAGAVHDDGPDAVADILAPLDRQDLYALAVVLAAMVDVDRSDVDLLGWLNQPPMSRRLAVVAPTRPCGTHAAFARHQARGEEPCPACREAEHEYHRAWMRQRRAAS